MPAIWAMIKAAHVNDQIRQIAGDMDISEFFDRLARDYRENLGYDYQQLLDDLPPGED
jgi:hypothetical protein